VNKLDLENWICTIQQGIEAKYVDTQYEWMAARATAITSTGDKAFWSPGMTPHVVRGWALIVTTGIQAADPVTVSLDKRITAGSDTGRVNDLTASAVIPGGTVAGKVYYKDGFQAKVSPGEELVFEVTDASAAGALTFVLLLEPSWEEPLNNTNMVKV
jgi:hypothetical protein